jgi:hypothetical protein
MVETQLGLLTTAKGKKRIEGSLYVRASWGAAVLRPYTREPPVQRGERLHGGLFVAEGAHGVEATGAQGWDIAGGEGDDGQAEGRENERDRIVAA